MVPGLLITSVVTAVMSAALFTRRSRTGWLDELADIRGGALREPDGEVDQAMGDDRDDRDDDVGTADAGRTDDRAPVPPGQEWAAAPPQVAPPVEASTEAPHPLRPHEVWHAHDGLGDRPPARPRVEERVAGEEIQDDRAEEGDTAPRFRFARLRPVGDQELHHEAPAAPTTSSGPPDDHADGPPPAAGPGGLFLHDHPTADPTGPAAPGVEPLVPHTIERSTNGLIDGPVRRGRRRARRGGIETPTDPWRALGLDGPEQVGADLDPTPDTPDTPAPAPAIAPAPGTDDLADRAAIPVEPPPDAVPAAVTAEPPPAPPSPVELEVGPDGVLPVAGTVRLDLGGRAAATRHDDGTISVDLGRGWCWAAAADPVHITTPGGELAVPPATTALSVVEADGSTFSVVTGGEAVLTHPGGRLRLRAGAMVLSPPDGEPQVDVATEAEIAGDPLVARNRALDAAG